MTVMAVEWTAWEAEFWKGAVPRDRGHRTWGGAWTLAGEPTLLVEGERRSALRVAFRIAQGRDAVGAVRGSCQREWCVLPGHLSDRVMRETALADLYRRARYDDVDWAAVLRCLDARSGPYPPLNTLEKRFGLRLSDPRMPGVELAGRLGVTEKTVSRWRERGQM